MHGVVLLVGYALTVALASAETSGPAVSITGDGVLAIAGSAEVPPYVANGRWTEMKGRSSARHVTRHFIFMVAGGPPAMELYVSQDLTEEPPDGAFEIGLVGGYLSGFSSGAGLRYAEPVWDEVVIGGIRLKRCRVELTRGERRLWLYAYVFLRRPSLTFLTLRPRQDAEPAIEDYLKMVRLRYCQCSESRSGKSGRSRGVQGLLRLKWTPMEWIP